MKFFRNLGVSGFKVGDEVVYTGADKPVYVDPLTCREGKITYFYDDEIVHVKFNDGTDGIIHIKNLKPNHNKGANNEQIDKEI